MNKGKSKKKMNSYLKMVLIMLAGGVVGGIFGFVTSYSWGEFYSSYWAWDECISFGCT
ncbi:MAG: hypothetical protein ACLTER_14620 [Ruminococcus sp.]